MEKVVGSWLDHNVRFSDVEIFNLDASAETDMKCRVVGPWSDYNVRFSDVEAFYINIS